MNRRVTGTKQIATAILTGLPPLNHVFERMGRQGFPVFMFHRVLPEGASCYESEMATSTELFAGLLEYLKERYEVVDLGKLVELRLKPPDRGKPLCAITFDDGWRDVYLHAFPLLKELSFPATVFLPACFIGTSRRFWQERLWLLLAGSKNNNPMEGIVRQVAQQIPWCPPLEGAAPDFSALKALLLRRSSMEAEQFVDRLEEKAGKQELLPERAFVNWDEVREMKSAGVSFGSHTVNHSLLTRCDPKTAAREVENSRRTLSDHLGEPIMGFSYPWGAMNGWVRHDVERAGYGYAVTTRSALLRDSCDRFAVPRLPVSSAFLRDLKERFSPGRLTLHVARGAFGSDKLGKNTLRRRRMPRRVRIAFVIDAIDSWEEGGTERQLKALIESLDGDFFEPELFFLRQSRDLPPSEFPCPVRVAGQGRSRFLLLRRLFKLIRERQPDIVQCFFRDGTYYGTVAAFLARVPVIVSVRRNAGHWISALDRLALKVINPMTDSWQCNSRAAFEFLHHKENVPAWRIDILPNAIDMQKFSRPADSVRAAFRSSLGVSQSTLVVVSVANLTPVKDPGVILEAAPEVIASIPETRFLIVGEGPLRGELEARIEELGLAEAVKLCGAQTDVRPFLACADIGLLTSRSEGSSNSLLEYMAMGLPSVVSDIPANREFVEGVFFEAGDSRHLSETIRDLWHNAGMRAHLRDRYRQQAADFGLDALARRAQSYYMRCVSVHCTL
jgi:glycosyltransferase involved in cell wall biosynthesis